MVPSGRVEEGKGVSDQRLHVLMARGVSRRCQLLLMSASKVAACPNACERLGGWRAAIDGEATEWQLLGVAVPD